MPAVARAGSPPITSRLLRLFVPAVAVLALAAYIVVYATGLATEPIRSDAWAYYVYLPATLIFHDPSLKALARDCCAGTFPSWIAILRWPSGEWLSETPMGVAVLALPFFVGADALTWWTNLPRDGFSPYYQHAFGLAGVCYFVLGLWLLRRVLSRLFSDGVVLATLVCLTWGTDLFHYGTRDSTFSHAFSFCLCAALLDVAPRWFKDPTFRRSVVLGSVAGLLVLVRHPNALLLVAMSTYGLTSRAAPRARISWIGTHLGSIVAAAIVGVLWLVPQAALDHHATGAWIVNAYGTNQGFQFGSPRLWEVLFSSQKGLFVWSPLLLIAVGGVFALRGQAAAFRPAIVVTLALQWYLIASWWSWQFGQSFGHRGFTDVLPFFAVGLAAAFDRVRGTRTGVAIGAAASLAVCLSIAQMIQYWIGVLPGENTTWATYWHIFLRFRP